MPHKYLPAIFPSVSQRDFSKPPLAIATLALCGMIGFAGSCGVPNLEEPDCSAARTAVREFYSLHFGNEMRFSNEGLKLRERFLSPSLKERVRIAAEGTDPFTTGDADLPKAFRAGECRVLAADKAQFDILLLWKDDVRTEQRTIKVELIETSGRWQVDKIER